MTASTSLGARYSYGMGAVFGASCVQLIAVFKIIV